jgi:molecular chaperone DnaK
VRDRLEGELILGIDLGTTNSGIAVWDPELGRPRMLLDPEGQWLVPSIVAWDGRRREWTVGREAELIRREKPGRAAYSIKRLVGRRFHEPCVRLGLPGLPFKVIAQGGDDPLRELAIEFDDRDPSDPIRLTPPEVSAKVLSRLRAIAADGLGRALEQVKYAVITVPAYFNMLQRRATRLAGELAGFEVVDIIDEPTAAALAYGDSVLSREERRVLIFDLGGGTFDVSLLAVRRDEVGYVFSAEAVDGDTTLGGDDIDASVARWLAGEIEKRFGRPIRPDDHVTRDQLRRAAEKAKIALSTHEVATIDLQSLDLGRGAPFDARIELTRGQLEACARELLRRARTITRRVVEDVAELTWDAIHEVILVGGQTLMPAVQREVEELTGRRPRVNDRPQVAVALGAAEYAHILSLGRERFPENALINVIALPLGIRLDNETFKPLVPANATVPHVSRPYPVTTMEDNQTSIHVEVLQGPRGATRADECVVLGSIDMEVPPAPARVLKFEVQFDVQSDSTMRVEVADVQRDRRETIDIVLNKDVIAWRDQPHAVASQGARDSSDPDEKL